MGNGPEALSPRHFDRCNVIVLIFFVMRVAPSDPASLMAGPEASEEQIESIREAWGLNKPLLEQFGIYIRSLLTGDAGMSFQYVSTPSQCGP